jgi:hypothetical protein
MLNTQPACAATDATCNQKLFLTAINSALLARAQTAIFLTVASPEYTAQH